MAAFAFAAFLCEYLSLPPGNSPTIEPLSGGFTNHTVRALFAEPVSVPGTPDSARHKSLILKHAPPYIASLGPEHALSTQRQTIEARALGSFSDQAPQSMNFLDLLRRHPSIRIPQLLYHDKQKCVLVMSDLGPLPTLLDYLATSPDDTRNVATSLAAFLADLHLSTRDISAEFLHTFVNEDSSRVVQELVGSLPRKILKSAGVADANALGENVERDIADVRLEPCFGMVDLWPGSVLVGENVGLVDWEYAGKSSAGSELGMLVAHLRIPLLSPTISEATSTTISNFVSQLLSVYATRSKVRSDAFIRCLLLAHGRELINAVEFQSAELAGDEHKEALIHAGARSLRAAAVGDKRARENSLSDDERLLLQDVI